MTAAAQKIKQMRVDRLVVVADFDRTLSAPDKFTSWQALKQDCAGEGLSQEFHRRTTELYQRFHPIEVDHSLPRAERAAAMHSWWEESHALLINEKPTKQMFQRMAKGCGEAFAYRENTDKLFARLRELRVPCLVFSAGLGDMIDALLELEGWLQQDTVHVLSNHLRFDGDGGVATGFTAPNLTTFNKGEVVMKERHVDFNGQLEGRDHVLLLGDSLGDAEMADGFHNEVILRVGFLNEACPSASTLTAYEEHFDIVLQQEPSMDAVLQVLEKIVANNK